MTSTLPRIAYRTSVTGRCACMLTVLFVVCVTLLGLTFILSY